MTQIQTYTLHCRCSNCGHRQLVEMVRGKRWSDAKAACAPETQCEKCGCLTLNTTNTETKRKAVQA